MNINSDNIRNILKKFISEEFLCGDSDLRDDESLFDTGTIDSLGMIKLMSFIEKEFHIVMNPTDVTIENFSSIEKTVRTICKKIKNR